MKLTETKLAHQNERKVVIAWDLPYSREIFDQTFPAIDHKSGVLILAADKAFSWKGQHPRTDATSQGWQRLPWQAELAGTDRQIQTFLQIHFPSWKGKLEPSKVWKMEDVELAGKAAAKKAVRPVQEQFTKILNMRKPVSEASYYRTKTASEVYDRMNYILDYSQFATDEDGVDVADFGLGNVRGGISGLDSPEVATVYLIVSDQDTEEGSIEQAKEYLRKKKILFHDIKSEPSGVENQWYVEAQYVDPITEAQYDKPAVNMPALKRVFRYIRDLIDGELDEFESKETLYIIASKLDSDEVRNILTKELGDPLVHKVPEFTMPWLIWEKEGFKIVFKDYRGLPEVEIMSNTMDNDPIIRREREIHDNIMDPSLYEAQYAYQKLTADEVVNRYIDFIEEHKPNITFGDVIIVEHNFSDVGDALYASLDFWVLNSSILEAKNKVESFAKHFDLPYTKITIPLDRYLPGGAREYQDGNPAVDRDVQHNRVYASMWYKSENKLEVLEASYDRDERETFFVVDETGDGSDPVNIVGPFGTKNDADKYVNYMKKIYGEWITFNFTVTKRSSPDNYEKFIKQHYDWSKS